MPYEDDDKDMDEKDTMTMRKPMRPPMAEKNMGMQGMITLLGKMRALMQAMAESKDMAMMPQMMSMMDEMQGMMAKLHGGSHYQKE